MSSRFVAPFVAVAIVFASASPAFAQSFKKETPQNQPSAVKVDFSARAAGMHTIAASTVPASSQNEKKPIMKRPVTWVAIAVVAVVAIYFAARGGYGTPGSGY